MAIKPVRPIHGERGCKVLDSMVGEEIQIEGLEINFLVQELTSKLG
jgi:hypothetical protein